MYDPASAIKGKDAVFQAHPENPAVKALADLATDAKFDRDELTITVARESIVAATLALRQASYIYLEDVTAVDWYPSEPRFQISYSILSFSLKQRIRLVVRLDGEDASLDSITPAWPAANFYEREIFDLFRYLLLPLLPKATGIAFSFGLKLSIELAIEFLQHR